MIEICVDSLESAIIASNHGADRLEVCSALVLGGLTPSYGMVKLIKEKVKIPLHILIRPRQGDFIYNQDEVNTMIADIKLFKELGIEGIVIGAITLDSQLDINSLKKLIMAGRGLHIACHRAFDQVCDPYKSAEQLINLGVNTILTSGCKPTAYEGRVLIKELMTKYGDKITIMPGSGVNAKNYLQLKMELRANWMHLSAKKVRQTTSAVMMGDGSNIQNQVYITDPDQLDFIKKLDQSL